MKKQEFDANLREALHGMAEEDIQKSIEYYNEMIDERMENGLSEKKAIEALGPMEDLVKNVLEAEPLSKIVKEKVRPKKKLSAGETALIITLLILASPLLIAIFASLFAVYVALWAAVVAVFAAAVVIFFGGLAALFISFFEFPTNGFFSGLLFVGGAGFLIGLAVLLIFAGYKAFRGLLWLLKKIALSIKRKFVGNAKEK